MKRSFFAPKQSALELGRRHKSAEAMRLEFAATAVAVRDRDAAEADTIGYQAVMLVQATLPHSPSKARKYTRTTPWCTVSIQGDEDLGLPYGPYPRLILAFLTTEAVRNRSPVVELGDSLAAFLEKIDKVSRGGSRGTIDRVRLHLQRLACAGFSWSFKHGNDENAGPQNIRVYPIERDQPFWVPKEVKQPNLNTMSLWDEKQPAQRALWKSQLVLNERFYRALVTHPVPLDMRVLTALARRKSPLAIDLYSWLTYRMFALEKDVTVPWGLLEAQFGSNYARARDFKAAFSEWLPRVLELYPRARATLCEEGLRLAPSPTSVPARLALI